jgi:hypothetical protein
MSSYRRFTPDEALALALVLDELIPPTEDGRMPGAGALGLEDHIAAALHAAPALREMLDQSLAALADLGRRRNPQGLDALSVDERSAVLSELAASEYAVTPVLALHAYSGYYQHPRVLAALGLDARAPHPAGYAIAPNDLSLLDPVRRRPELYRRC